MKITSQIVERAVADTEAIFACYGVGGAAITGERIANSKNTTKFNGRLLVCATWETGNRETFQAHDLASLRRDVVAFAAGAEYSRWMWADCFKW